MGRAGQAPHAAAFQDAPGCRSWHGDDADRVKNQCTGPEFSKKGFDVRNAVDVFPGRVFR
jgi:hypothetical protein